MDRKTIEAVSVYRHSRRCKVGLEVRGAGAGEVERAAYDLLDYAVVKVDTRPELRVSTTGAAGVYVRGSHHV
jgi:hypothetical protein